MILSAGLTPAWQQILVFDHFCYGEVNRAKEAHWCASGKVFNAGIAVHRLGGPSLTLATVGGPPRVEIDREFAQMGAPHRWVVTETATRICTTILDRATGTITELVENGRPLAPRELDEFHRAYAETAAAAQITVITGSLPGGTPVSFYRKLVECTPGPVVLDFRGEGLLSALDRQPYVVKPNREELAGTLGRPITTDDDLRDAMHCLNRRGAQWVVVTQGKGPVWVTSAKQAWKFYPMPAESIVNPIGCGDALAAGIAWATHNGRDLLAAVRFGMAAAWANLQQLRPCRFNPAGLDVTAERVRIESV
ncbi:MAG: 1-phosphofructokinase family hexose kinase [Thermoguttaceae bacterium]